MPKKLTINFRKGLYFPDLSLYRKKKKKKKYIDKGLPKYHVNIECGNCLTKIYKYVG